MDAPLIHRLMHHTFARRRLLKAEHVAELHRALAAMGNEEIRELTLSYNRLHDDGLAHLAHLTGAGGGICELDNVRPLSVTNADNRIIANAVRYLIEPIVGPKVTNEQRDFVGGRSMVANIVDIE